MDIEKDSNREAFEAIAENIRLLRGAKFKDGEYVALSLFDESSKELAAQLNYGWEVWQAAKAQAIPDGFVLVPMVPSERIINAVRQCYEGEAYLPYSLYSEFVNQAIIERMEAQEPADD